MFRKLFGKEPGLSKKDEPDIEFNGEILDITPKTSLEALHKYAELNFKNQGLEKYDLIDFMYNGEKISGGISGMYAFVPKNKTEEVEYFMIVVRDAVSAPVVDESWNFSLQDVISDKYQIRKTGKYEGESR